jgi:hypothetical protein
MTRSNLIRGGKRFPAITADLPEGLSAIDTATDSNNSLEDPVTTPAYAAASTWSNSIGLFFGDMTACPSAVAIGRRECLHTRKLKNDRRTSGIVHASASFEHRPTAVALQCSAWRYEPGRLASFGSAGSARMP